MMIPYHIRGTLTGRIKMLILAIPERPHVTLNQVQGLPHYAEGSYTYKLKYLETWVR